MLDALEPGLGGGDLEVALAHVRQVLRWPHDQVYDRPHEREQGGRRGAANKHRVGDAAACVGEGPVDQRQPDDDEEQQQ